MTIEATLEPVDDRIGEFCSLINAGVEAWVKAGALLCEMKAKEPGIFNVILAAHPYLSNDLLLTFERIGKREIYPYLLVDGSPGSRMLSALPYDTQVQLYHKDVPVVVRRGDFTTTLRKTIRSLTKPEAVRVFDGARMRSVSEQTKLVQKSVEADRQKREASRAVDAKEPEEQEGSRSLANRLASAIVQEYAISPGKGDDDARSALSLLIGAQLAERPLDKDPKAALAEALTLVHDLLLEARSHLAQIQRNSKFDVYIQNALSPIGQLRFALNSGGIAR